MHGSSSERGSEPFRPSRGDAPVSGNPEASSSAAARLRLSRDELTVACALLVDPGHELLDRPEGRAAREGLERSGVAAPGGSLREPAATIARVVAQPSVRLEASVWPDDRRVEHRAWADVGDAVIGDAVDGAFDLTLVHCERLLLAIAGRLGLGDSRQQRDDEREPLVVPATVLVEARRSVQAGETGEARAQLLAVGIEGERAARALDVLAGWRRAWGVTASWRDLDSWHPGRLLAADAGAAGWWELEPRAQGVRLVPTDSESLWSGLGALLPG